MPRFDGRRPLAGVFRCGAQRLALHVVARYLGDGAAAATAKYMEHASDAWRG